MARTQFNRALTTSDVEEVRSALVFYYPQVVGENARADPGKHSTKKFSWTGRLDFDDDIKFATGTSLSNLKGDVLYQSLKNVDRSLNGLVGSNPVEGTRPTKEQLEVLEAEAEAAKARRKETVDNAKKAVEASIKKQQEIQESLKDKKVYAKVEAPQVPTPKNPELIKTLQSQAAVSPENLAKDLYPGIKSAIESDLKDKLAPEDIDLLAKKTALNTAAGLANPTRQATANSRSAILGKMATDASLSQETRQMAGEILLFQNVIASRNIMMGIDPDIAWAAFGASIDDFRVSLSDTQIEGTATVNLYQMGQGYIQLLQNQSAFFDNIGSLAQTEAKSFLMGQARLWLDGQIAGMSPEIAGVYDSAAVQNALKLAGFGQPVAFGETAFGSVILKIPGAPAFLEGLGGSLGIDLVGGAGTAAATAATEAAVTVGSGAATSAATAITAEITGAAAAPVTGGLSLIISIIVAIVGPKVIKFIKDNAQKYSKFIVGLVVGTFGFLLAGGSILGGILGFGIGYGGAAALTGGLPAVGAAASSFFSGASTAAGIIWTTFLAGAGKPILITLFVFPVVVAFILFIINSGAYIVPPAPRGEGSGAIESPYIDVVKTAIPPGPFENEDLPLTVEYKIEVKAKKGPLQNVSIKYSCSVIKEASSTICPEPDPGVPATVEGGISPATPFSFTYKQTYNELNYQDSFVTDVITVTADAVEQSGARAADSATIKIGEPPEDCPSIWPTNGGSITQGAYTSDSHKSIEAIDVGTGPTTVLATHSGVIVSAQNDYCYGNNIKIQSNCGGRDFISRYAHLEGMSIGTGQAVTMGQTIGLSGNSTGGAGTKCSTGYHLHYEFKYWPSGNPKWPDNPPFMMNPYIPEDVRRGCVTREACGVSW